MRDKEVLRDIARKSQIETEREQVRETDRVRERAYEKEVLLSSMIQKLEEVFIIALTQPLKGCKPFYHEKRLT